MSILSNFQNSDLASGSHRDETTNVKFKNSYWILLESIQGPSAF